MLKISEKFPKKGKKQKNAKSAKFEIFTMLSDKKFRLLVSLHNIISHFQVKKIQKIKFGFSITG